MLTDNDKANRWIDKIADISNKVAVANKRNVVQTAIATIISMNANDYTVRLISSPDDGSQDFNVYSKATETFAANDAVMLHYVGDLTNAYIAMKLDGGNNPISSIINAAINNYVLTKVYPVGSIYMSTQSTSPQTLMPGTTWERITGRFLMAATDGGAEGGNSTASVKAGYTGGEATHAITVAEMAQHGHRVHVWDNAGTMANAWYYNGGATKVTHTGARLYNAGSSTWIASGSTANAASSGQGDPSGTTALVGSGTAHNNIPPYLAVYVWKRLT